MTLTRPSIIAQDSSLSEVGIRGTSIGPAGGLAGLWPMMSAEINLTGVKNPVGAAAFFPGKINSKKKHQL
jgi:hypothetical protein